MIGGHSLPYDPDGPLRRTSKMAPAEGFNRAGAKGARRGMR